MDCPNCGNYECDANTNCYRIAALEERVVILERLVFSMARTTDGWSEQLEAAIKAIKIEGGG